MRKGEAKGMIYYKMEQKGREKNLTTEGRELFSKRNRDGF